MAQEWGLARAPVWEVRGGKAQNVALMLQSGSRWQVAAFLYFLCYILNKYSLLSLLQKTT